jgi:hypothetical protein
MVRTPPGQIYVLVDVRKPKSDELNLSALALALALAWYFILSKYEWSKYEWSI